MVQQLLQQAGLAGVAGDVVDRVSGQPRDANRSAFRKVLTEADLVEDAKTIPSGDFTPLSAPGFQVPAQEQYRHGYGAADLEANQGFLYVDISADAGAGDVEGVLRIQQRDAQQRNIITVFENRTDGLDGSLTDRQQQQPLPEQRNYPKVGRDSYLNYAMDPDSEFDIGTASSESQILHPVTVYPV